MTTIDCEIYLAMNEDGDWIVTDEETEALNVLSDARGGSLARVVKVTVKMTPPVMAEATVTVPDDVGTVEAAS